MNRIKIIEIKNDFSDISDEEIDENDLMKYMNALKVTPIRQIDFR